MGPEQQSPPTQEEFDDLTEKLTKVEHQPEVTYKGLVDMQVCVPGDWTDEQVVLFASLENPSGTIKGWGIRKEGNKLLRGKPDRQPCTGIRGHTGCVHIMLDALTEV